MIRLAVIALCVLLYGTADAEDGIQVDRPSLSFIVIGDWGRQGSRTQRRVAEAMDELASHTAIDLIISTGDNFYQDGVASENDPLWGKNYETVYWLPHLKAIPWYVVLGNHDYRGNVRAQIDYGKRHRNWRFPHYYHEQRFFLDDAASTQFIFVDTSPFIHEYRKDLDEYPALKAQDPKAQMDWLRDTLNQSKPDWRVVIGHHPVYSSGRRHGDSEELQDLLTPLFAQHGVNAYFAGHDHHLEHYKPEGATHYFISGGGAEHRRVKHRADTKFAAASAGFAHVLINKSALQLRFINHKGKVLYSTEIKGARLD